MTRAGHVVVAVGTAAEALYRAEEETYALMLLDLNLPDGDGLEVAERLRGRRDVPIVMLTARADVDSRVEGLYAGAADYIAKPFSLPQLLARIHVRLRERAGPARPAYENLELDPDASLAVGPAGDEALPEREFTLLRLLVEHPGRLYATDETPGSNTDEVFVHLLRRRLDRLGVGPRIRTVRGKGYMLRRSRVETPPARARAEGPPGAAGRRQPAAGVGRLRRGGRRLVPAPTAGAARSGAGARARAGHDDGRAFAGRSRLPRGRCRPDPAVRRPKRHRAAAGGRGRRPPAAPTADPRCRTRTGATDWCSRVPGGCRRDSRSGRSA